jgi:hypothetical protein
MSNLKVIKFIIRSFLIYGIMMIIIIRNKSC